MDQAARSAEAVALKASARLYQGVGSMRPLQRPLHAPIRYHPSAMSSSPILPSALSAPCIVVLAWLLRVACGLEFIGHGAFGIITKPGWVPYFGVIGIPPASAYHLMPVIGSLDIILGILALVRPMRWPLVYMATWGLWTALLRPLSGEPFWETLERAPNYLIPLSLLIVLTVEKGAVHSAGLPHVSGTSQAPGQPNRMKHYVGWLSAAAARTRPLDWILRLAIAGAFIGHGAFGVVMNKPAWNTFFSHMGIPAAVAVEHALMLWVGGAEMILGVLALVIDAPAFFFMLFQWKLTSEIFWYVPPASPFWEIVERGSNYAAPLALVVLHGWPHSLTSWFRRRGKRDSSATGAVSDVH